MKENIKVFTPEKNLILSPQVNDKPLVNKRIISASRRSDIPAFYADWFMERIRDGVCRYKNPFGGQLLEVNLESQECLGIVFWTRYPVPMFKFIPELHNLGYRFYFQFTITGYPRIFETHNPPLEKVLNAFKKLSDMISPDLVFWRYDPLIFSELTSRDYHLEKFENLCKTLAGYTKRCYFSFADYYSKTRRNFEELVESKDVGFFMPVIDEQIRLSREMCDLGKSHRIELHACCSDILVGDGIFKASCVDDKVFKKEGEIQHTGLKPKPSRDQCGCIESTDIGTYDSCLFGCMYCYATKNRSIALRYYKGQTKDDLMQV